MFKYMIRIIGPKSDPCGTPLTWVQAETVFPCTTLCLPLVRYALIQLTILLSRPQFINLSIKYKWGLAMNTTKNKTC